ncbi:hypothetical protein D3C73_969350 [compost metagenome]
MGARRQPQPVGANGARTDHGRHRLFRQLSDASGRRHAVAGLCGSFGQRHRRGRRHQCRRQGRSGGVAPDPRPGRRRGLLSLADAGPRLEELQGRRDPGLGPGRCADRIFPRHGLLARRLERRGAPQRSDPGRCHGRAGAGRRQMGVRRQTLQRPPELLHGQAGRLAYRGDDPRPAVDGQGFGPVDRPSADLQRAVRHRRPKLGARLSRERGHGRLRPGHAAGAAFAAAAFRLAGSG